MSKTKILFLCTGNSCRGQMAEGWARLGHYRVHDEIRRFVERIDQYLPGG